MHLKRAKDLSQKLKALVTILETKHIQSRQARDKNKKKTEV